MNRTRTLIVTVELQPAEAAGLMRFADKVSHDNAACVLCGHVNADIRAEQAGSILSAFGALERALAQAHVRSWPWIETGCTSMEAYS